MKVIKDNAVCSNSNCGKSLKRVKAIWHNKVNGVDGDGDYCSQKCSIEGMDKPTSIN